MSGESDIGKIQWCDLTISDADQVKVFYEKVVGWKGQPTPVSDYHDWTMFPSAENSDSPVSGICHSKGPNEGIPAVWMVYINVSDLQQSIEAVKENGGKVIREANGGPVAVIQDPSGAICALYQKNS